MNIALGLYYGTARRDSLPAGFNPDVQEVVDLKNVWDATREGSTKLSGVLDGSSPRWLVDELREEVQRLGGVQGVDAKISEARPWLEKWSEGERIGYELARAQMEREIEEALRPAREVPPLNELPTKLSSGIAVSELVAAASRLGY